jgi:FkbM family methyltransferase
MSDTMFKRLEIVKNYHKFQPNVIYDIGAHKGVWTQNCKTVFPDATYYQFEANADQLEHLHDNPIICLLGNEDEKSVVYYKDKKLSATGNSIFREKTAFFDDDVCEKETRTMKRLDSVIQEKSLPFPDFIKLDVQGAELLVLEGAPACMLSADVIMMEVSVASLNEGSPLIHDALNFMANNGFVMFDIAEESWVAHTLVQLDLLFCKKDSRFHVKDFHWAKPV